MTEDIIREAMMKLQGAVTIVYPMNLPPHDPIRLEFEGNEDLSGTQVIPLHCLSVHRPLLTHPSTHRGVLKCSYHYLNTYLRCGLQCNLSIEDTTGTQLAVLYTVEPLYTGHHWDPAGCPVYSVTSL